MRKLQNEMAVEIKMNVFSLRLYRSSDRMSDGILSNIRMIWGNCQWDYCRHCCTFVGCRCHFCVVYDICELFAFRIYSHYKGLHVMSVKNIATKHPESSLPIQCIQVYNNALNEIMRLVESWEAIKFNSHLIKNFLNCFIGKISSFMILIGE